MLFKNPAWISRLLGKPRIALPQAQDASSAVNDEELAKLSNEIEELRDATHARIQELSDQLAAANADLEKANEELSETKAELALTQDELGRVTSELTQAKEALEAAHEERNVAQSLHRSNKTLLMDTVESLAQAKAHSASSEKTIEELRLQVEELTTQIARHNEEEAAAAAQEAAATARGRHFKTA